MATCRTKHRTRPAAKPADSPLRQEWRAAERRVRDTNDWFLALAECVAPGGGFIGLCDAAWRAYCERHGVPPFDPHEGLAPANGDSGAGPNLDNLHEFIHKIKMIYDGIMELAADHGVPLGPGPAGAARTTEDGGLEPERQA